MNNPKEIEMKASAVASVGAVGGGTGKSGGAVTTKGVTVGTAKDTTLCDADGVQGGQTMKKKAETAATGGDEEGTGTPVAKKQKVAGEVTPTEPKGATLCESCNKREVKDEKDQNNNCDRCGKTAVCISCTTVCGKCEDSICDKCRDESGGPLGWHNELTYCDICDKHICGKCGGDDFDSLCEDPSEGLVCRDCVEKAEAGYFGYMV